MKKSPGKKYLFSVLLTIQVFLWGCAVPKGNYPVDSPEFARELTFIDRLVDSGHFDEAVRECDLVAGMVDDAASEEKLGAKAADILFEEALDYDQAVCRYLKLSVMYPDSPERERYMFRLALSYENMSDYVNAGLTYSDLIVEFPDGKYYRKAAEGAERCFEHNSPDVMAIVENRRITQPILDRVLEDVPHGLRRKFETRKGKYDLIMQTVEQYLLVLYAQEEGLAQDGNVKLDLDRMRYNYLSNLVMKRVIEAKAKVTDEQCRKFYDEHVSEFIEPEKVRLFQIKVADEAFAREIHDHLDSLEVAGGDVLKEFRRLAREVSVESLKKRLGDLGYVTAKDKPELVIKEGLKLDEGEYSPVFMADGHFNIVFNAKRIPEKKKEFSEVLPHIRERLKKIETHKIYKDFTKELMTHYRVKVFYNPDTGKVEIPTTSSQTPPPASVAEFEAAGKGVSLPSDGTSSK